MAAQPQAALQETEYKRKRTARAVLTGMCYSAGSAMRHGSSSLTRLTGQSAMTPSRQPGGCGLSWPEITVIKTDNIIVFQVVICPVQLNPVNENLPLKRSKLPRYVVKLHDDDFFDEEDAEALRFDNFDDAVECCADLNIPFFVDAGNKKLVFWFVRVDDEGYPEIARCTEREFATILAGISAGGMYCPECGTVHWPDGVPLPF
ncbi:hypothetical protein H6S22_29105 (plasmid) [Escherichia coli]|nr:hypothetical protein H6S22_29105 [Escherichia coli]